MALALLWEEETDGQQWVFGVDTGTNPFFRLLLGTGNDDQDGMDRVDDLYWSSPWQQNPAAGRHFQTKTTYRLDASIANRPHTLVQLQSAKNETGQSTAYSAPIGLSRYLASAVRGIPFGADVMSGTQSFTLPGRLGLTSLKPTRTASVRSAKETFSRPLSLDDLLGAVVRAVLPLVQQSMGAADNGSGGSGTSRGNGAPAGLGDAGDAGMADLLATLLRSVLSAAPTIGSSTLSVDRPTSGTFWQMEHRASMANPLASARAVSRPLVFGIDDALLAALIGPVLQSLPELLNAAGQVRETRIAANNQLARDALGATERMRITQLLETQEAGGGSGRAAEIRTLLMRLLAGDAQTPVPTGTSSTHAAASAPAPGPAPVSPGAATSASEPLSVLLRDAQPSKAVLRQVLAIPTSTDLSTHTAEFAKNRALTLRFALETGSAGPTTELPRSILHLALREPGGLTDLCTVSERIINLTSGKEMRVELPPADVAALPTDTPLELRATLRWPGAATTYQAGSSSMIMLRGARVASTSGTSVGGGIELTDMARFRPFWNRLWSYDGSQMWGLDATIRYSVIFTATDRGNALMTTRSLLEDPRPDGLRVEAAGRMKGGLEAGIHELNRLLPLWQGETELTTEELAPFAAPSWIAAQGGDAVLSARFDGRKGTHGQLWAVPVLSLRSFTIASPTEVDPFGQITATTTSSTRFPTIEALRLIGLVSNPDAGGADPTESGFAFEGYRVALETTAGLEPAWGGDTSHG
jgi:hypothetical protein